MSSKSSNKKKKVVVSTGKVSAQKQARVRRSRQQPASEVLLYGKQHFILMGAGVLLIILGLALMAGGSMENYDTFNPDKIYSFRRTALAPALMIAGFILEIYMIFKK